MGLRPVTASAALCTALVLAPSAAAAPLIRNGTVTGFASNVRLIGASRSRVVGLTGTASFDEAIRVDGGGRNVIRATDVVGRQAAIDIVSSPGARVVENRVFAAFGPPIALRTDSSVVARNRATEGNDAIGVEGDGNRVVANAVRSLTLVRGAGNLIARNWAIGAAFDAPDGFTVPSTATNTMLRGNVATGNLRDGFRVDSPSTRLVRNVANANGDLGIEAVPGVVGIGNAAAGNGDPAQCVGVLCG